MLNKSGFIIQFKINKQGSDIYMAITGKKPVIS